MAQIRSCLCSALLNGELRMAHIQLYHRAFHRHKRDLQYAFFLTAGFRGSLLAIVINPGVGIPTVA